MRANGYDRLACVYDLLTRIVFAGRLQAAQHALLAYVPSNARVLVLGGGTGWWLPILLQQNPRAHISFVEPSGKMLQAARRYASGNTNVTFIEGTQHHIPAGQYDVMMLFCVLDLFEERELSSFIEVLKSYAHDETCWLINDFQQIKWWHRPFLSVMYLFFQLTTDLKTSSLPHWQEALRASHLVEKTSQTYFGNFIFSGIYVKQAK